MLYLIWTLFGATGLWVLGAMILGEAYSERNKPKEPKFDIYKARKEMWDALDQKENEFKKLK